MQGRYKRMKLAMMVDDVAYRSRSTFTAETSLVQEAYLVLVRPEARRVFRSEQYDVLNQFSQAIAVGCKGTNGHGCVQVETLEGELDLKLARTAVILELPEIKNMLIGDSRSAVIE